MKNKFEILVFTLLAISLILGINVIVNKPRSNYDKISFNDYPLIVSLKGAYENCLDGKSSDLVFFAKDDEFSVISCDEIIKNYNK